MLTVLALRYSGKGNTGVNQPGLMVSSSSMTDTVLKMKVHGTWEARPQVDKHNTCSLFTPLIKQETTFHGQQWPFWKGPTTSGAVKMPVINGKRSRQQHFGLQWASTAFSLGPQQLFVSYISEKIVPWDRSTADPCQWCVRTRGWDCNWVIRKQQGARGLAPNIQILWVK